MMKEKNLLQSIICYFLNVLSNGENINDIFNESNKEIDKKIENGNYNFDINPIGIREIKKEGPFFIECKHIYCI